jgi:hypothetical protein
MLIESNKSLAYERPSVEKSFYANPIGNKKLNQKSASVISDRPANES